MIRRGPSREREDKTGDPSAHPIHEPPSGRHRGESGALSNEGMRRRVRNIDAQLQEKNGIIRGSRAMTQSDEGSDSDKVGRALLLDSYRPSFHVPIAVTLFHLLS